MAEVGTFGGILSLISVADGESGTYTIEVNHDRIYKFYTQSTSEPSYSPSSLVFKIYDTASAAIIPPTEYSSEISLLGRSSQVNNVWGLLGRLNGYPLSDTEYPEAVNLLTATRTINALEKTIEFNFVDLFGYDVEDSSLNNSSADISSFIRLLRLLREENCYFVIEAYQSNAFLGNKPVSVEFGLSNEMAKFAVTATTIEAAIDSTKLQFDVNGLTIKNGGLKIYEDYVNPDLTPEDPDYGQHIIKPIFYYDDNTRSLYVEGRGTFTGEIHASAGSFAGDVSADNLIANAGTIGGFIIQQDGLYSRDGETIEDASLKLLSDGRIDAENINLGVGAHINKYLQLGEKAFIWNPDHEEANHFVIEIKDSNNADVATLDDNGIFRLGNIIMDGRYSTISGNNFRITPTLASFNNISASGKISTAIFEQGHIQSIGGLMMFKPSYKIEAREGNNLTLDQDFKGEVGNYVYIIQEDGTTVSDLLWVTAKNDNVVTLNDLSYNGNIISLIDVGVENDVIIGINSTDVANTFLRPRGFTISEFKLNQTDPNDPSTKYIDENVTPKVFLGDLDTSGITFSDTPRESRGFGLYSENVYLTGSLTTKINTQNPTYAGVNTLDGTNATVFVERNYGDDTSPIVFWAGSVDTEARHIQAAPFQVTANGSIYATQGIFTGAIITESYITGADLYAARIHGTGTEQEGYGLAIYDSSKGIVFFRGEQNDVDPAPTEVFSIGTSGLKKGTDYFIEVEESDVNFYGTTFTGTNYFTDKSQNSYIHVYQNSILGANIINENEENVSANITFNQQGMSLGASNFQDMNITQGLIKMSTDNVQMDNTILFGEHLKYEKVNDGYNLFVSG